MLSSGALLNEGHQRMVPVGAHVTELNAFTFPSVAREDRDQKRRRLAPHPLRGIKSIDRRFLRPPAALAQLVLQLLGVKLQVDRSIRQRQKILTEHRLCDANVTSGPGGDTSNHLHGRVLMQKYVVEQRHVNGGE